MKIIRLQTDHRDLAFGIDERNPALGWMYDGDKRYEKQTAYRVTVATTEDGAQNGTDLAWDTDWVTGDDTLVVYDGEPLRPRTAYYWTVRAKDQDGVELQSSVATFETALFGEFGDQNYWITLDRDFIEENVEGALAAPVFRRQFTLTKPLAQVTRARLYSTAAGSQNMYLNGTRASDDFFAPGKSKYSRILFYQTYDVLPLLKDGDNTLGAEVGHGWFNAGAVVANYGPNVALKAKLIITYADGTEQVIDTDKEWLACGDFRTTLDKFYVGHYIDGRKYADDWCQNDTKFSKFGGVRTFKDDLPFRFGTVGNEFVAERMTPVRHTMTLTPTSMTEPKDGVFLYHFDQNIAGTSRIIATAPAGCEMVVKYGEYLNDEGILTGQEYLGHNGSDRYIFRGDEQETVTFDLTYHGFEYLQIEGIPEAPALDQVEGWVLTSDIETTGEMETSHPLINRYLQNILWSLRGNFISTLTDCPTREKNSWTGDAQIFAAVASYVGGVYNHYRNFQDMTRDSQFVNGGLGEIVPEIPYPPMPDATVIPNPVGWCDSIVIVPWELYNQFGDKQILTENYDAMTRFFAFVRDYKIEKADKYVPFYLKDATDVRTDGKYGDWLHLPAYGNPNGYHDPKLGRNVISFPEIGTAYAGYMAWILSKTAAVLGKEEDAALYADYHRRYAKAWRVNFVADDGYTCTSAGNTTEDENGARTYHDGDGWPTSYAFGLCYDLYENDDQKRNAAQNLARAMERLDYHQNVGFLGMNILYPALSRNGQFDTAMRMMETETYPSLLYSVTEGATTIWETYQKIDYSRNHYVFSAPGRWLFADVLGITHDYDPQNAGYRHFILQPQYSDNADSKVTWVKGHYRSENGLIKAAWHLSDDRKTFTYTCTVPANTSATLKLPIRRADAVITENGADAAAAQGVTVLGRTADRACYELQSGTYTFTVQNA